jgi:hypothetical protein
LAHGFTVELMGELVRAGLTTATTEPMVVIRIPRRDDARADHKAGRQALPARAK